MTTGAASATSNEIATSPTSATEVKAFAAAHPSSRSPRTR